MGVFEVKIEHPYLLLAHSPVLSQLEIDLYVMDGVGFAGKFGQWELGVGILSALLLLTNFDLDVSVSLPRQQVHLILKLSSQSFSFDGSLVLPEPHSDKIVATARRIVLIKLDLIESEFEDTLGHKLS